jgi:hypothetical protein
LKILIRYDISRLMSVSPPLRSKKEALDTVDRPQAPTPEVDRNVLTNDVAATAPLSRLLKRDEVKTK